MGMMSWMRDNENNFPVRTMEEVTLNNKDFRTITNEPPQKFGL